MRKRRVVGRVYGMEYSWKGHRDRNRHKNRIERNGPARLVYVFDINHKHPHHGKVSPRGRIPLNDFPSEGDSGITDPLPTPHPPQKAAAFVTTGMCTKEQESSAVARQPSDCFPSNWSAKQVLSAGPFGGRILETDRSLHPVLRASVHRFSALSNACCDLSRLVLYNYRRPFWVVGTKLLKSLPRTDG